MHISTRSSCPGFIDSVCFYVFRLYQISSLSTNIAMRNFSNKSNSHEAQTSLLNLSGIEENMYHFGARRSGHM